MTYAIVTHLPLESDSDIITMYQNSEATQARTHARLINESSEMVLVPVKVVVLEEVCSVIEIGIRHWCEHCGAYMTSKEWEERHTPHDKGCNGENCDCDNNVHERCCWEC